MSFYEMCSIFESERWTFAKTMPAIPHQWVSRKTWSNRHSFDQAVQYIRDHGRKERWGRYNHEYLYLSGYKYWTMGASVEDTLIINRARPEYNANYEGFAEKYDKFFGGKEYVEENKSLFQIIKPRGKVLDIGCGTGLLVEWASHISPDSYFGIDPSQDMLQRFGWKHPAYSSSLRCSKFEDFWMTGFDTIVCLFGTASYLPNATRAKEMLNAGGTAYLMYYKKDYDPITHKELGVPQEQEAYFTPQTEDQFVFGNYIIERLRG